MKPSNVLIDEAYRPKICDFDVGRRVDAFEDSGSMTVNVGTFKYMAPECSSGQYSMKSDYFSFGALLYEVFEGIESAPPSFANSSGIHFSDETPKEIQDFIRYCLVPNPDERGNFEYVTNPLFSSLYDLVHEHMGLDERELSTVHDFVESLERDEEIIANDGEEL